MRIVKRNIGYLFQESNSLLSNVRSLVLASETNRSIFSSEVEKSMYGFKAHMKIHIQHRKKMLGDHVTTLARTNSNFMQRKRNN